MAQIIYTDPGDELADLVERVRTAAESEVGLVVNSGAAGIASPLNVRLIAEAASRSGKKASIISGDPHIQHLAQRGGIGAYASVPAFERGIQVVQPHLDGGTAASPAIVPELVGTVPARPLAATTRRAPASALPAGAGAGRHRALYFAAIGLVVIGLLLLVVVAPSAKVLVTLSGTPLSVAPTIQGSTDSSNANQGDHLVTTVISSDQQSQFTATPTGHGTIPPTAATATLHFTTTVPNGIAYLHLSKGEEFDTADTPPIRFLITQDTDICIGPDGKPPIGCQAGVQPNADAPVQEATAEAKGNVPANTITKWGQTQDPNDPSKQFSNDPCDKSNPQHSACAGGDISVTNPQPATGGADPKPIIVASAGDLASWTGQVAQAEQTLTATVNQDMQQKSAGLVVARDAAGNGASLACGTTPPLPQVNQPFATTPIIVACHGKAAAYNAKDVTSNINADLQTQVAHGESLAVSSIKCGKTTVTQATDDGTVVLSVECTAFSQPNVDLNTLRGQLTGKGPGEVKKLLSNRLAHVQHVSVSQSPLPLPWLPWFSNRIEIDETFVDQAPAPA